MTQRSIDTLVVGPSGIVVSALATELNREPDIQVLSQSSSSGAALSALHSLDIDVAVVDAELGDEVFELIEQCTRTTACRVVALVVSGQRLASARCVRAGAAAVLEKDADYAELVLAIRTLAQGGTHLSPQLLARIASDLPMAVNAPLTIETLTPREREVLNLLASGSRANEIASLLCISRHTVRTHISNLRRKLGARSQLEAVTIGIRAGLTGAI